MMVSGRTERKMDMGFTNGQMVPNIMEIGEMAKKKALVNFFIQMELNISVNISPEKKMELEISFLKMALDK